MADFCLFSKAFFGINPFAFGGELQLCEQLLPVNCFLPVFSDKCSIMFEGSTYNS